MKMWWPTVMSKAAMGACGARRHSLGSAGKVNPGASQGAPTKDAEMVVHARGAEGYEKRHGCEQSLLRKE